MNENPHAPLIETYPCEQILFRALPFEGLVRRSDGVHKRQTFIRREEKDPKGLSLFTSIAACKAAMERPIYGVRSVHVGTLRDYNLDVFPDTVDHGNIRYRNGENIPSRETNHPLAFQIADDLMSRSRPIHYWDAEDADARFQAEMEAKRF